MRIRFLVLAVAALLTATSVAPALADQPTPRDEVSPEEDNPDGCVNATTEDAPQCGAMGREHNGNPGWQPPIEACADPARPSGSRITRVLPNGPRHGDGSLAFIPGVCVYLPPGYGTNGLRYPVVYLLHGGGGDQGNWVTLGDVPATFDAVYADDPANAAIAVMPDGRSGMWFDYYDGSFLLETYVLRSVVPYIDRHFDTIPDRSARAIAGLSNGGYGALHFASKAPDLFSAVGSMSGNIGARTMGGLGTPVADGVQFQEAGAHYYGSVPIELIPNLDDVDVVMDLGSSCAEHLTPGDCGGTAFDHAFLLDHKAYDDRMASSNHVGDYDYRETEGGHTWLAWSTWLRERHLPFFLSRLVDPQHGTSAPSPIPVSFRYRTIKPSFSIHGYDVSVTRPAKEFLDLIDVTIGGFTVRGSGTVAVVTASRYAPLGRYVVNGVDQRADSFGRLHLTIDLGAGHEHEQYSPIGRVDELQPGYWREQVVAIATG